MVSRPAPTGERKGFGSSCIRLFLAVTIRHHNYKLSQRTEQLLGTPDSQHGEGALHTSFSFAFVCYAAGCSTGFEGVHIHGHTTHDDISGTPGSEASRSTSTEHDVFLGSTLHYTTAASKPATTIRLELHWHCNQPCTEHRCCLCHQCQRFWLKK